MYVFTYIDKLWVVIYISKFLSTKCKVMSTKRETLGFKDKTRDCAREMLMYKKHNAKIYSIMANIISLL